MKTFNGKAIYQPAGKAAEYAQWACNFYVGCSNGCEYCYCKKGILAGTMGGNVPTLKKCFKDEGHALTVFKKELLQNIEQLREHGLFFSFTTDPMLPETSFLTLYAIEWCVENSIPIKILTKCTAWINNFPFEWVEEDKDIISFGFTLTGHDELEPNASTNAERIKAMKKLHAAGFKTFASIEPVIDFFSSYDMFIKSIGFCDLYKVGLESGKHYDKLELHSYLSWMLIMASGNGNKIYFKDSLLKQAGISRESLPENCVGRDYKIHSSN